MYSNHGRGQCFAIPSVLWYCWLSDGNNICGPIHRHCPKTYPKTCRKIISRHILNRFTKLTNMRSYHFIFITIWQPGSDLRWRQWSLLNSFCTAGSLWCLMEEMATSRLCACGEPQTMCHIVNSCPLTNLACPKTCTLPRLLTEVGASALRFRLCFHTVSSHAFSVFQLEQGSVATLIGWGGWNSYRHMCRSFLNPTVKTALKFVNIWRSYRQNC